MDDAESRGTLSCVVGYISAGHPLWKNAQLENRRVGVGTALDIARQKTFKGHVLAEGTQSR